MNHGIPHNNTGRRDEADWGTCYSLSDTKRF